MHCTTEPSSCITIRKTHGPRELPHQDRAPDTDNQNTQAPMPHASSLQSGGPVFAVDSRLPEMPNVASVSMKAAKKNVMKAPMMKAPKRKVMKAPMKAPMMKAPLRKAPTDRKKAFLVKGDKHEFPEDSQVLLNAIAESRRLFHKLLVKNRNGRWCAKLDDSILQESVRGKLELRSPTSP